ncbi:MAG: hypothetical protein IT181_01745 [Acidobacteria bacterium]|nr:hypothetical protein [Acidobacteriota bacterium]
MIVLLASALPLHAQSLGTFSWRLQPFRNIVTVNIVQAGSIYPVDGPDDLCGAAPRAAVTGVAFINPNGTVGLGMSVVLPAGPAPLQVTATIDLSGNGTWQDSGGHSGSFLLGGAPAGSPRPVSGPVFTAGLSAGGAAVKNVGAPTASTDAATKGYVDTAVAGSTAGLATQAFVTSTVATATTGLASQALVTSSVAAAAAGTIRVVAPQSDWVPFNSSDPLTHTFFSSQRQVSRTAAGSSFLSIHPHAPVALYGKAIRFIGVEFCYDTFASTTLNYVEVNIARRTLGRTLILSDPTTRTGLECRTYTLPTPATLTTGDSPNMFIQVNWTAPGTQFAIGPTTFIFEQTTTPAP